MAKSEFYIQLDHLIDLAKGGHIQSLQDAVAMIAPMEDHEWRDWYLGTVVPMLAGRARWNEALDLSRSIQHIVERTGALVAVAGAMIASGIVRRAIGVLNEAEVAALMITGEDFEEWQEADALNDIATLHMSVGQKDKSIELWQAAIETIHRRQALHTDNFQAIGDNSSVLGEIARNLARASQIALAETAAKNILNEYVRNRTLQQVEEIESGQL